MQVRKNTGLQQTSLTLTVKQPGVAIHHMNSGILKTLHIAYLLKCLAGVIICYVLYKQIPQYPFYWAIVSVVLAISPDNSNKQAYSRIKANFLGCFIGMCFYPLHLPEIYIICFGIIATVLIGVAFKMMDVVRIAMAALIIVTLKVEEEKHWYIALERVVCVVAGCLVALLLTLISHYLMPKELAVQQKDNV